MLKKIKNGFTLAELLVVVAIIAVLVAIAIPVFTSQLQKAKVATDIANLRAYYAEIQADYIENEKANSLVPEYNGYPLDTIKFLDGKEVKLKAGVYIVNTYGTGYVIIYYYNENNKQCETRFG